MKTHQVTMLEWPPEEDVPSTSTTAAEDDLVLFSQPAINPAYTLVFGVIATNPPLQNRQAIKYVRGQRLATGGRFQVPWFEIPEDRVESPGATMVSLVDWPEMCGHPERLKAAHNLAGLIAHFESREMEDWHTFLDSFSFFLKLHDSPLQRFRQLMAEWKSDVRFLSDTNEICTHPAYQQIIGMGILALPFIFAELECGPDQWFWALKAITGHDPVPEGQRGDFELMTKAWLRWSNSNREKLGADWARVFLRVS